MGVGVQDIVSVIEHFNFTCLGQAYSLTIHPIAHLLNYHPLGLVPWICGPCLMQWLIVVVHCGALHCQQLLLSRLLWSSLQRWLVCDYVLCKQGE